MTIEIIFTNATGYTKKVAPAPSLELSEAYDCKRIGIAQGNKHKHTIGIANLGKARLAMPILLQSRLGLSLLIILGKARFQSSLAISIANCFGVCQSYAGLIWPT
jgi:hypothetical protein